MFHAHLMVQTLGNPHSVVTDTRQLASGNLSPETRDRRARGLNVINYHALTDPPPSAGAGTTLWCGWALKTERRRLRYLTAFSETNTMIKVDLILSSITITSLMKFNISFSWCSTFKNRVYNLFSPSPNFSLVAEPLPDIHIPRKSLCLVTFFTLPWPILDPVPLLRVEFLKLYKVWHLSIILQYKAAIQKMIFIDSDGWPDEDTVGYL